MLVSRAFQEKECTAVNRFVFYEGVLRSSGEGGASQDQGDESKRSCSDQNHNGKGDFLGHREKPSVHRVLLLNI